MLYGRYKLDHRSKSAVLIDLRGRRRINRQILQVPLGRAKSAEPALAHHLCAGVPSPTTANVSRPDCCQAVGGWVNYFGGSTTYWSYATFPIPDAGSRLVGWLFPRVIELSGERLAELVKRPD
jgi:hypothetical protein